MTEGKKRILLIDDSVEFASFVQRILTLTGEYEVEYAVEGHAGLQLAKQFRPDLILLDVMMPGLSGTDIALKLEEDAMTTDIPIIFLTGLLQGQDPATQIAGRDILSKPIEPGLLIAKVRQVLGNR